MTPQHDSLPHRAADAAAHGAHHGAHHHRSEQQSAKPQAASLNWMALSATLHCLSGCAVGEVLGMVIGTALGMSDAATIALAVALAFFFGYAFTMVPLLRHGLALRQALKLALAADTVSITIMEITDNLIMLAIPGAMDAPLNSALFWSSLALALVGAGFVAYPANRWLIARGRGHRVVHTMH